MYLNRLCSTIQTCSRIKGEFTCEWWRLQEEEQLAGGGGSHQLSDSQTDIPPATTVAPKESWTGFGTEMVPSQTGSGPDKSSRSVFGEVKRSSSLVQKKKFQNC